MSECDYLPAQRFNDYVNHHAAVHELIEKAQVAAEKANDYRLERLNELRQQVEQDRGLFVTGEAFALKIESLELRIRRLENSDAGSSASMRTWIAAVGFILIIVQIALRVMFP